MTYAYRMGCGSSYHVAGCSCNTPIFGYSQRSEIRKIAQEEAKSQFNKLFKAIPKGLQVLEDLGVVD
jgi:hypothetical protein